MKKEKYDYIVNGATVLGSIYSIQKAMLGKKVLLLNNYGFPGGSITQSLNCYQKKSMQFDEPILEFINRVKESDSGILYENESYFLLNPEIVKYVLQEMLENSNVDLLYHSRVIENNLLENKLTVSLKEGLKEFEYEEYSIISESSNNYNKIVINIFAVGNDIDLSRIKEIERIIILDQNRYFINISINDNNDCQEIINKISDELFSQNARIQLLPTEYFYEGLIANDNLLNNSSELIK